MTSKGIGAIAALTMIIAPASSALAGYTYASVIENFDQGLTKDGNAVAADRSDPTKALGAPQANDTMNFVSLGYGGELVVSFGASFTDEAAIVWETTYGNAANYPEAAEIFVGAGASWDTATYYTLGVFQNTDDGQPIDLGPISAQFGVSSCQFIKIVDTTDPGPLPGASDGFDVDAVGVIVPTPGAAALAAITPLFFCSRRRNRA